MYVQCILLSSDKHKGYTFKVIHACYVERKIKEKRRKNQEEDVKRKKQLKEEQKQKSLEGMRRKNQSQRGEEEIDEDGMCLGLWLEL